MHNGIHGAQAGQDKVGVLGGKTNFAEPKERVPASDWIASDLSFLHQTQQGTLAILHSLHQKLLGPVPPGPACDPSGKTTASNAGLLSELGSSMGVIKEQMIAISRLSEDINRAI